MYAYSDGYKAPVMAVTFDTTGEQVISSSCDRTVKVWDIDRDKTLP
jgi:WD40 repeat protein